LACARRTSPLLPLAAGQELLDEFYYSSPTRVARTWGSGLSASATEKLSYAARCAF